MDMKKFIEIRERLKITPSQYEIASISTIPRYKIQLFEQGQLEPSDAEMSLLTTALKIYVKRAENRLAEVKAMFHANK